MFIQHALKVLPSVSAQTLGEKSELHRTLRLLLEDIEYEAFSESAFNVEKQLE